MKKVLVIEDESAYLKLLKGELVKNGYKVEDAMDGEAGLKKAVEEKPDLILLDIRLPIMDGMTMLHELRKKEGSKKTKVIVLTNLEPDTNLIHKSVEDQPIYYLVKSDTKLSELIAKVKELI